jgi:hypothetical protein
MSFAGFLTGSLGIRAPEMVAPHNNRHFLTANTPDLKVNCLLWQTAVLMKNDENIGSFC